MFLVIVTNRQKNQVDKGLDKDEKLNKKFDKENVSNKTKRKSNHE